MNNEILLDQVLLHTWLDLQRVTDEDKGDDNNDEV